MKQAILFFLMIHLVGFTKSQTPPIPRHLEEIAYDAQRKVLVMYGGIEETLQGIQSSPADINECRKNGWKRFNLASPGGRYDFALLYHKKDKVIILIGGSSKKDYNEIVVNSDVWKWDGQKWQLFNTECPLSSIEAAYDPMKKRVLVYGKAKGTPHVDELWEFKSNAWRKLSAAGPSITTPYEVAFDTHRKSLVLPTWENGKCVMWEWKEEQWLKTVCNENCPSDRYYFSLAYQEKEKAIYMFGGRNNTNIFLDELWKWDGSKWTRIETKEKPSMRCATTMEYADGALLLYGGVAEWGTTNEMWQWKNGHWKSLNGDYALNASRKLDSLKYLTVQYSNDAGLFRQYGSLLRLYKQYEESEVAYKQALSLNALDHYIFFELMRLLYEQKKDAEAENYIENAVKVRDMPARFYSRLGPLLYSIKKYQEGINCINKAIQIQPQGSDFYNLARGYVLINNKDKAFEALNQSIKLGLKSKQQIENDPDLETLKSDVRWSVLLKRLE